MMQRRTRAQAAVRAACSTCHQRKVKCDAQDVGIPCTNCRSASKEDCRVHQKRKRVSKAARAAASATASHVSPNIFPQPSMPNSYTMAPPSVTSIAPSPDGMAVIDKANYQSTASSPNLAGLTGLNINAAEDGEYLYKRHLVEFIDQPELVDRPIDNKARMTYIGSDVSNINLLVRQQFGTQDSVSNAYHFPTNRIPQQLNCHEGAGQIPLDAFQLPPKVEVDELLEAYFRHVNPGFPVVDEHTFMALYRARDPANPPSLALLQAVLVVGAHVLYSDDRERRDLNKSVFFCRAKSLLDVRFERNRDTIVQAALLLTWHTEGVEDVAANAWYWLGVAVRTATGLGMHRDADDSTLVPHNKIMWRRVWWLLFQSDVWVSLQYGRPQSIHLEDTNVKKLGAGDYVNCGDDIRRAYVEEMTHLAIIVSKALRARSRASTPEAQSAALRKTDERLASWALHLPQSLHLDAVSGVDTWTANLHIHYNTALLVLHRSLPSLNSQISHMGIDLDHDKICGSAAGVIQCLFQALREARNLKCLWMSAINCLFTALIQLSIEIRLSNPILAIAALRNYDSALVSLKQLAEYWPNAKAILHFFEKSVRINSSDDSGKSRSKSLNVESFSHQSSRRATPSRENTERPPHYESQTREESELQISQLSHNLGIYASSPGLKESQSGISEASNAQPLSWSQDVTEEILDAWKQWQSQNWSTPEFSDASLFTF